MKTNFIFIFILAISIFGSCDKKDEYSIKGGKIVFYTNAQAMLNCGPFDVDVYIGNSSVGTISEPYIEDTQPECNNSSSVLMIERKPGFYTYTAKINCGQYGEWSDEFEVISDSCTHIFLDINTCNPKND